MQQQLLALLRDGDQTSRELFRRYEGDPWPGNITLALDALVQRGLIERRVNPHHERMVTYHARPYCAHLAALDRRCVPCARQLYPVGRP